MSRTPLTEHFSLEELTRVGPHADIDNDPPPEIAGNLLAVATKLELARAIWGGVKVRVDYGYRCEALNKAAGGSETSAHMQGLAADVVPDGIELRPAWDALAEHPDFMTGIDQLIIERGCIHIGLPVAQHNFLPRHELRLDEDDGEGHRTYPLYGHWTPHGIERVGDAA